MTEDIIKAVGFATIGIVGVLSIIILIGIFIEEFYSKVKFWRLIWRKFRRWLIK